jgi:hypothetical protein
MVLCSKCLYYAGLPVGAPVRQSPLGFSRGGCSVLPSTCVRSGRTGQAWYWGCCLCIFGKSTCIFCMIWHFHHWITKTCIYIYTEHVNLSGLLLISCPYDCYKVPLLQLHWLIKMCCRQNNENDCLVALINRQRFVVVQIVPCIDHFFTTLETWLENLWLDLELTRVLTCSTLELDLRLVPCDLIYSDLIPPLKFSHVGTFPTTPWGQRLF